MEVKKGFKQTELGVIPEDWEVNSLGELGRVRMCKRIFNLQTESYGDIPFFKIGTFGKEADAFISKELYDEYCQKYSFPKKGSLLISAAGTIGRVIKYDGKPSYFQDSNIVWIDNNEDLIPNSLLFYILQNVKYNTEGGTIQRLYNGILRNTKFVCPPLPEQTAIATALSDMDALITQTENLIEKKKAMKQGMMQELLKPKDGWVTKTINEVVKICHGKDQKSITSENGMFPILGSGGVIGFTNAYLYDKPSVLIGRKGTIDKPRYIDKPFWTVDTLFYTVPISEINLYFLYCLFQNIDWYKYNEASGVPSLNANSIGKITVYLPPILEQEAITVTLSEMDKSIYQSEIQLDKMNDMKQGMMQELLTGRIRLL
jgi:type I restriction enzyme S subunit